VKKNPKGLVAKSSLENLGFYLLSNQQFDVIKLWLKDDLFHPSTKSPSFFVLT